MKPFRVILFGLGTMLLYQNCTNKTFSPISTEEKAQTISETPVFVSTPPSVSPSTVTTQGQVQTQAIPQTPTSQTTSHAYSPLQLVMFNGAQCDLRGQSHYKLDPIVVPGVDPVLTLTDSVTGSQTCLLQGQRFIDAMAGHGFYISQCQFIDNRTYTLDVSAKLADGSRISLVGDSEYLRPVSVLYQNGSFQSKYITYYGYWQPSSSCNTNTSNLQVVSPLVIHMSRDRKPASIELTSIADGILFDILGERSLPAPHTPKQISWFTSQSAQTDYLVALPDPSGNVWGIDQLFGDNTKGPDGKFAANGYLALAKYDLNHDGYIDEKDPVFSKLRFWADGNTDGVAQRQELYSAKELQIKVIDLNYDDSFKEVDMYGNETRMKSVVQTEDGSLHLLYDLWFRAL